MANPLEVSEVSRSSVLGCGGGSGLCAAGALGSTGDFGAGGSVEFVGDGICVGGIWLAGAPGAGVANGTCEPAGVCSGRGCPGAGLWTCAGEFAGCVPGGEDCACNATADTAPAARIKKTRRTVGEQCISPLPAHLFQSWLDAICGGADGSPRQPNPPWHSTIEHKAGLLPVGYVDRPRQERTSNYPCIPLFVPCYSL